MLTKGGILKALEGFPALYVSERYPAWIGCDHFLARVPPPMLQAAGKALVENDGMAEKLDDLIRTGARLVELFEDPKLRRPAMTDEWDGLGGWFYLPKDRSFKVKIQERYAPFLEGYRVMALGEGAQEMPQWDSPVGAINARGDLVLVIKPMRH